MELTPLITLLLASLISLLIANSYDRYNKKKDQRNRIILSESKRNQNELWLQTFSGRIRSAEEKNRKAGVRLNTLIQDGKEHSDSYELAILDYRASTANWLDVFEEGCEKYNRREINRSRFKEKFEEDIRRIWEITYEDNIVIYEVLHDNDEMTYINIVSVCAEWFEQHKF